MKVKAFFSGPTVIVTRAIGRTTRRKATAPMCAAMATSTSAIGAMIKSPGKAGSTGLMAALTKVIIAKCFKRLLP